MNKQKIIIFDSPDGTGKTEISKALSKILRIPYFKMNTEHQNWRDGRFKEALEFDQPYITQFLKQTGHSAIFDRAYPAEFVYSPVFRRPTNLQVLRDVDLTFADMGTIVVIPLRRDYAENREDEVVPPGKLNDLHDWYKNHFTQWTNCQVIHIYVDDYDNQLEYQIPALERAIEVMWTAPDIRHIILGKNT